MVVYEPYIDARNIEGIPRAGVRVQIPVRVNACDYMTVTGFGYMPQMDEDIPNESHRLAAHWLEKQVMESVLLYEFEDLSCVPDFTRRVRVWIFSFNLW